VPADTPPVSAPTGQATRQFDIPQAKSLTVVTGPGETVYVLAGSGHDLHLYRSQDGAESFAAPVLVSQGTHAEVLAVVRPALAVRADGHLGAAWVEPGQGGESHVRAAWSGDGGQTFSSPVLIASTTDPETTMASVAFDTAGLPLVAWLQHSSVRLAAATGKPEVFGPPQIVDDLVCECCQPVPLAAGDQVVVAYRNLVRDAQGVASRDIYVAASADGGATFAEPVKVSDDTWRIDVCPIAGPALVERAGSLFVAWMDGRFDDGTFSRTDIWLAASPDGGASFGPNVRVNGVEGQYNGQPSLVIDRQGRVHVAWAADTPAGSAVQYAVSVDNGQSFAPARSLVSGPARLGNVQVAVSASDRLYLAWTDPGGAHLLPLE
jgi:hypothetical protein